jgi:hypothetical protein
MLLYYEIKVTRVCKIYKKRLDSIYIEVFYTLRTKFWEFLMYC